MKQLLSYFKPHLKESFLAPLFKLPEAVLNSWFRMVIAEIVDQSIPKKIRVTSGCKWVPLCFCGYRRFGSLSCSVFYSAKAVVGFAKELTNDLYRHILSCLRIVETV